MWHKVNLKEGPTQICVGRDKKNYSAPLAFNKRIKKFKKTKTV